MATSAAIGSTTTYEIFDTSLSPDAYATMGEVTNIDPGSDEADLIDVTHMASPSNRREYIQGLIDGGEGTVELNFVPGGATDVLIRSLLTSGAAVNHRITFPNNARVTFAAIIRSIGRSVPVGDRMVMTFTAKKTGAETWDTAS